MSYLLDTNHCSYLLAGDRSVLDRIAQIGIDQLAICVITEGELIYMAENSAQSAENLSVIEALIDDFDVYAIDSITSRIYGRLKASLMDCFGPRDRAKRRRTKITDLGIGENDLWIATIAIQHDLTVVSGDRDFVRIQEAYPLKLENWQQTA